MAIGYSELGIGSFEKLNQSVLNLIGPGKILFDFSGKSKVPSMYTNMSDFTVIIITQTTVVLLSLN